MSQAAKVQIRPAGQASASDEAAATAALTKLAFFAILLAVLPIGTYFWTLGRVFDAKDTTSAGIAAAVMVNVVLVAYLIVAFTEDTSTRPVKAKAS